MNSIVSPAEVQQAVGQAAKHRRLALGLRQTDAASAAGVTLSTLRRFEEGGNVGFSAVVRIAFALRAEPEFAALFPAPEARSLDDILRAQRSTTRKRARARK